MFVVATNQSSLFTQRQLDRGDSALDVSLQRLSSGLRINSAKDDAAGVAIADRLTSRFRGSQQGARNANDAISYLQTAEGAMGSVTDLLQRVREIAVQAANGSNSLSDRRALQLEASQLTMEIDNISRTAQFNGDYIFPQGAGGSGISTGIADPIQSAVVQGLGNGWLQTAESRIETYYGLTGKGDKLYIGLTEATDGAGGWAAYVQTPSGHPGFDQEMQIDLADFNPPNLPNGGTAPFYNDRIINHEMVHAVMNSALGSARVNAMPTWFLEGAAEFIHGGDERLAGHIASDGIAATVAEVGNAWASSSLGYASAYAAVRYIHEQVGGGIKGVMEYLESHPAASLDDAFQALTGGSKDTAAFVSDFLANGQAFITTQMNLTNIDTGAIGGLDADGGPVLTAESVVTSTGGTSIPDFKTLLQGFEITVEGVSGPSGDTLANAAGYRNMTFQVGASTEDVVHVGITGMSAEALGVRQLDLSSFDGATAAMTAVDAALDRINRCRADLGAQLSRIEQTISAGAVRSENIAATRSRIIDSDYAAETASLARNSILRQSGLAMSTQANASTELALNLLKGL